MSNNMKKYQSNAKIYEGRWKYASEHGHTAEMYSATRDYEKNIKLQENELKKMDPNSREFEKAKKSIESQKANHCEMSREQRNQSRGDVQNDAYNELEAKNKQLSHDMRRAAEKGETAAYEQYRNQYEKNVDVQEQLGKQMREDGIKYKDTSSQSRQDIYSHDCTMRDKLSAKVAEREAKGKEVSAADRAAAAKYKDLVKKDEQGMLKHNGDRTVESMKKRGASEDEIKFQEEKNKQAQEQNKRGRI